MKMLVLSRKDGQSIVIDGKTTIIVSHHRNGTIKLAIEAPPDVSILRGELVKTNTDEE